MSKTLRGTHVENSVALTDSDMVVLLHNMARDLWGKDEVLSTHFRQIADRLSQLADKAATRRHWTGQE